jgi:hypothetical protein
MRVGKPSGQVTYLRLSSAARLSAEAVRATKMQGATEAFLQMFNQALAAPSPAPRATSSVPSRPLGNGVSRPPRRR